MNSKASFQVFLFESSGNPTAAKAVYDLDKSEMFRERIWGTLEMVAVKG